MMKETNKKDRMDLPAPELYNTRTDGFPGSSKGINNPEIELPAFNPPVPNRAWTAMRAGMDIDDLTPEERADLRMPGL